MAIIVLFLISFLSTFALLSVASIVISIIVSLLSENALFEFFTGSLLILSIVSLAVATIFTIMIKHGSGN